MGLKIFFIRITVCFLLSAVVGLERQIRHRAVGLRTNVLVSLGSFLFVSMSFFIGYDNIKDVTRIASQVVCGIGFLGAGVILRNKGRVKGLNTAATLWCAAAIGVLCASGLLLEACIGTIYILICNVFLRFLSEAIMKNGYQKQKCLIKISCKKDIEVVVRTAIANATEKNDLILKKLERNEITKDNVKLNALIVTSRLYEIEDLVSNISAEPGVTSISYEHKRSLPEDLEEYTDEDDEVIWTIKK